MKAYLSTNVLSKPIKYFTAGVLPSLCLLATPLHAVTWTGGGDNPSWGDADNWSDPIPTAADVALFDGTFPSGSTLTLGNAAWSVKSLTFQSPSTSLTINSGGASGGITIASGNIEKTTATSVTIVAPITLGGSGTWNLDHGGGNSGALKLSGSVSDGGAGYRVTKSGGGDLVLAAANDVAGFTISNGSVWVNHKDALGRGDLIFNNTAISNFWLTANEIANDFVFQTASGVDFRSAAASPYYQLSGNLTGTFNGSNGINFRGNAATWDLEGAISLTSLGAGGLHVNSESAGGDYALVLHQNVSLQGAINGRIQLGSASGNTNAGNAHLLLAEAFTLTGQYIDVNNGGGVDTIGGIHTSGTATIAVTNSIRLYDTSAGSTNFASLHEGAITKIESRIDDDVRSIGVDVNKSWSMYTSASGASVALQTPKGTVHFASATGNTYDGKTTIHGGTLLVSNSSNSATGTGAVEVKSGASLGGTGIITGQVAANAGSTLFAGEITSVGTLNLIGGLTAGDVTLEFDLGSSGHDKFNFGAGNLTLDGTVTVKLAALGAVDTETPLYLFEGTGAWSGTPTFAFELPSEYLLDTSFGTNGYLWDAANHTFAIQLTTIPEPGVYALSGGALVVLSGLLRKRRTA